MLKEYRKISTIKAEQFDGSDEMTVGVYDEAREKLCDERGLSEDDIDAVLEYAEIFCPMNALVRTITSVVWEED